jgi:hypothetical protein
MKFWLSVLGLVVGLMLVPMSFALMVYFTTWLLKSLG